MTTRIEFARMLLAQLGLPDHVNNYVALCGWMGAEFSPGLTDRARYNPLADERKMRGSTNFNSVGVQNYRSLTQGVEAITATLKLPQHSDILRRLRTFAIATTTLTAVSNGTWGTHFPGGVPVYVQGVRERFSQYALSPC
jgi:hypothetical protein